MYLTQFKSMKNNIKKLNINNAIKVKRSKETYQLVHATRRDKLKEAARTRRVTIVCRRTVHGDLQLTNFVSFKLYITSDMRYKK